MPRRVLTPEDAREAIKRASSMSESPPVPVMFRGKRQRYLVARIMLGTVTEAAAACGYNRSNAHRIEKDPAFKAALDQIVSERIAGAVAEVKNLLPLAVRRLGDILADPRAKDSDVIAAARELLDRGGLPKTNKVEVSDLREPAEAMPDDVLDAELAELELEYGKLRVINGGA